VLLGSKGQPAQGDEFFNSSHLADIRGLAPGGALPFLDPLPMTDGD